ncbi:hypothetical protein [Streptomyces anulatus]|uniref:hypothetical protein n=1 Tax=Streptomyces anulatus TaxID=1892 RepID=UPI001C26D34A|nr:hypothetical protein [Streptomyces anulatus]
MLSTPIPRDLCPVHREIAYSWRDHHYSPWTPSKWPGGSHIMDSRTSHAERGADWDRKNLQQIELTIGCCRSGRSPQCTPGHHSPASKKEQPLPATAATASEQSQDVPVPGAERWDLRLARTVLTDSNLPAGRPRNRTGYSVTAEGSRVCVTWSRSGSLSLPRAGTAARTQWDEALDRIEAALRGSAAFAEVQRSRYRVSTRAVVPRAAQTTARMRRVGALDAFRRAVRFDGHPAGRVGGTLTLATSGPSPDSFWIVTDAEGSEAGRTSGGYQAAAELLAHHYGLPMPLGLIDEGRPR